MRPDLARHIAPGLLAHIAELESRGLTVPPRKKKRAERLLHLVKDPVAATFEFKPPPRLPRVVLRQAKVEEVTAGLCDTCSLPLTGPPVIERRNGRTYEICSRCAEILAR